MCGITGYVGGRPAVETALTNLKRLEYRGYDSAGVAYPNCTGISIVRAAGKIANLEQALTGTPHSAHVAIAHTRWATHGRPNEVNAHPHRDCTGQLAVVHNGIIENYAELRSELLAAGHLFTSETDTEVLAHLIEDHLPAQDTDAPVALDAETFATAIRAALHRVTGSYAIAVISQAVPDAIFVARKDSPLIIGLGEGENFLASDIPAVMRFTRSVLLLEDGDFATLSAGEVRVTDLEGAPAGRETLEVTWDDAAAEKNGYPHFMLKEIHEEPRTIRDTLRGRLGANDTVTLPNIPFTSADWQKFRRLSIVGCGTAYHAGVVGKRLFEQILRRPVEVTVASEFRYGDPLVGEDTLVILISQSGETADTLAAMREAKCKGATTLAIVNVVGSSLARDADAALLTQAGPEIGVASTKAYLAQLTALSLLCLFLAQLQEDAPEPVPGGNRERRERTKPCLASFAAALRELPTLIEECLRREPQIAALAESLAGHSSFFYLGRGYDFAAALEAALKLKEISYLHAEAYPAGEMKHGPLALVEPGVAVIGFCTQAATNEKMVSNLKEIKAREGTVISVIRDGDPTPDGSDAIISVPPTLDALMPIVAMVPMQLLAYHVARVRGCEIDQPRNLAKSVTVE
ncbi:MAG: glutamine--fructose-6-phosphate transaminase [Chthonomonadales bacterium]|nr:glutamine--fructose-6-phosphate transaminase [Chthonomonadales bacterium]